MIKDTCNEIGGYFELETSQKNSIYHDCIALNSARNSLVYLIKARKINKIYLPAFNCSVIPDVMKLYCSDVEICYYHINEHFKPILRGVPKGSFVYVINYYAFNCISPELTIRYNIIADNSQAYFSPPINKGDTIYSPRKFFGVCDGGYLHTTARLNLDLERDMSWEHSIYLLKRIDCGASAAYADFKSANAALAGRPLKRMSRLTEKILGNVDYASAKIHRLSNFTLLHESLAKDNLLTNSIDRALTDQLFVPFCYPLLVPAAERIRKKLISERVYIPMYWPELSEMVSLTCDELNFVNNIVCLPVDQRYGEKEMEMIIDLLRGIGL